MEKDKLLCEAWEQEAQNWVEWARKPGHDSYWIFHRDQFLELLPVPGLLTLDIGCGEGRLSRHLKELGHNVASFDVSETLIKHARQADPEGKYTVANASALPLADGSADLAVIFMVLQDVDELKTAVHEIGRILVDRGRACIAIVHPINSAGKFADDEANCDFVIKGAYLDAVRYSDTFVRDGLEMTFHSEHRPLETYSRALESEGLLIEAIREHPIPDTIAAKSDRSKRWQRIPMFLHIRAIKLAQTG